jgi:hypothetical protein
MLPDTTRNGLNGIRKERLVEVRRESKPRKITIAKAGPFAHPNMASIRLIAD